MAQQKTKVKIKNIPQSALKLRLVADTVRGKRVDEAFNIVRFLDKKGSNFVEKALKSAVASAEEKFNTTPAQLIVEEISVDEGRTLKSIRFASRGRVSRINKRRSHLNLTVSVAK